MHVEPDDAARPAVHHLQRVERDAAVELDVAEAGQVVELCVNGSSHARPSWPSRE